MPNAFTKESARSLVAAASQVALIVDDPARFNLRPEQLARVVALKDNLKKTMDEHETARDLYESLSNQKAEQRADLARVLSDVAASVALGPATTDPMLVSLGFAPRSVTRTRRTPQPPTGLTARPTAYGTVDLGWDRAGNAEKTMFLIERSDDGRHYVHAKATTRTRETLPDCPPGVATYFRVSAANSRSQSAPSLPIAVYHGGFARAA